MTVPNDLPVPAMRGGGAMGQHVRETDWSQTSLGVSSSWPQSLRLALSLVLNTKSIAALYWGLGSDVDGFSSPNLKVG